MSAFCWSSNATLQYEGSPFKIKQKGEFPDGPVVRTRRFYCGGLGSIPGQAIEIPQAAQLGDLQRSLSVHALGGEASLGFCNQRPEVITYPTLDGQKIPMSRN